MEKKALAIIDRIDKLGGVIRAIEEGYPQREIADSAYQYQREVESGERKIVGVNSFKAEGDPAIETLKIDEAVAKAQIERLQSVRRSRSAATVKDKLAAVEAACRDEKKNLMYPVLDAARAYCSLGEISDVFRKVWGAYREKGTF
jgi:methylmalonyl-CoA mutase N-terminal domain/subunit